MRPRQPRVLNLALLLAATWVLFLAGCSSSPAVQLPYEIVAEHPHDPQAFTQGLEYLDGALYESTGLYGSSSLRKVDLVTGEVQEIRYLPANVFGEGLARIEDALTQLTWRAGEAYRWPIEGFVTVASPLHTFRYTGEGWGLCFNGTALVMSNGGSELTFRDPETFEALKTVTVTLNGDPIERLNELECVGDHVWANVWFDDRVLRIQAATGRVDAWLDLSELLSETQRGALDEDAVLNGLAWRPDTQTLLVTGKLWPTLFELRLMEP